MLQLYLGFEPPHSLQVWLARMLVEKTNVTLIGCKASTSKMWWGTSVTAPLRAMNVNEQFLIRWPRWSSHSQPTRGTLYPPKGLGSTWFNAEHWYIFPAGMTTSKHTFQVGCWVLFMIFDVSFDSLIFSGGHFYSLELLKGWCSSSELAAIGSLLRQSVHDRRADAGGSLWTYHGNHGQRLHLESKTGRHLAGRTAGNSLSWCNQLRDQQIGREASGVRDFQVSGHLETGISACSAKCGEAGGPLQSPKSPGL